MDVPIELQAWNYAQCAEYFGCTKASSGAWDNFGALCYH